MEVRQIPATDLESRLTLYQHLHEVDEPLPDPKVVKASWRTLLSNPRTSRAYEQGQLVSTCALTIIPN